MKTKQLAIAARQTYAHLVRGSEVISHGPALDGRRGVIDKVDVTPYPGTAYVRVRFFDEFGWFSRDIDPQKVQLIEA